MQIHLQWDGDMGFLTNWVRGRGGCTQDNLPGEAWRVVIRDSGGDNRQQARRLGLVPRVVLPPALTQTNEGLCGLPTLDCEHL